MARFSDGTGHGPAALVRGALEGLVLALVCLSPWALGSVHEAFEGLLYAGIGLILLLWAARALLEGALPWSRCPVALCLAGLFFLGVAQMIPLPASLLARLSPTTAAVCSELLPAERETLPPPDAIPPAALPAGHTISLNPGATRGELFRLLAVLLLFAAVRANAASPAALGRLAVAATANGAALAVFAFVQFLGSPRGLMYWSISETDASPFGPFICRNHFPFYLNLCIGLAIGLLLARRRNTRAGWGPGDLLNDPAALWIIVALGLMVASVAFSLSRGGLIALAVGCAVCVLLAAARGSRPAAWSGALFALALALGLLAWLGTGPLRARLSSLWEGNTLEEGRLDIWESMLPAVTDFPLLGTGFGTIQQIELFYRQNPGQKGWVLDHAHNDYLEALIEGGAIRLLLSLAAIFFVYRLGVRALRRYGGHGTEGLVLGALLGFTTVVVHSAVDFGIHVPAIAALTAVVAAQIAALGQTQPAAVMGAEVAPRSRTWRTALPGLAAICVAAALALVLSAEGWRMARAQSLRLGSRQLEGDALLRDVGEAAAAAPERADFQLEAASAYVRRYEAEAAKAADSATRERATRDFLAPALTRYVLARDLCPLFASAHMRLAAHRDGFLRADPAGVYIRRALRVLPSDPELHYLAGNLQFAAGDRDQAMSCWGRSLELSDAYQAGIVDRARGVLTDEEWLDRVLPPRAQQLVAAAAQLYPDPDAAERRPYYARALAILTEPGATQTAVEWHLKGVLLNSMGRPDEAIVALERALEREPRQTEWRCELVRVLRRQGRLKEAHREVLAVLADQPDHREGRQLLHDVVQEIVERRDDH
jgi:O-antigen ligase